MSTETAIDLSGRWLWSVPTFGHIQASLTYNVTVLNLSTCHVSHGCALLISDHLQNDHSRLLTLNLNYCRVSVSSSIEIFQAIPGSRLTSLSLDGNCLTQEACAAFSSVLDSDPALEAVSLRSCQIWPSSCGLIAAHLSRASRLRVLWLDDNSILDGGAEAIAGNLAASFLSGLSVRGGQVWRTGTTVLLRAVLASKRLTALDRCGNTVDLQLLGAVLKQTPALTCIAISNCRVEESKFLTFLMELPQCGLTGLILEGLNFEELPISSPKPADTLWTNQAYFDALLRAIDTSPTLEDVRIGFWDLQQIFRVADVYGRGWIPRKVEVVLSDFGRSGCSWVLTMPGPTLISPSPVFDWKTSICPAEAERIGQLFTLAKFDENPLATVRISRVFLTDHVARLILLGFDTSMVLSELDLSSNPFGDDTVDAFTTFLARLYVQGLNLTDTNLTPAGLLDIFRTMEEQAFDHIPMRIEFSIEVTEENELAAVALSQELGMLLRRNPAITELVIHGLVPVTEMTMLVHGLMSNSVLTILKILPPPGKFPVEDPEAHNATIEFVHVVHNLLTASESSCRLMVLDVSPFESGMNYPPEVIDAWEHIEKILEDRQEDRM
jgi:Ran GTPase-activating protein (RanGAP) involved in mRNA processing and transport